MEATKKRFLYGSGHGDGGAYRQDYIIGWGYGDGYGNTAGTIKG